LTFSARFSSGAAADFSWAVAVKVAATIKLSAANAVRLANVWAHPFCVG
jgi:hypothetical protein